MIKWCITTGWGLNNTDILYLGWQPYAWDNGYFWTDKDVISGILANNTSEHPFLFNSKEEAIAHLRTLDIPQKCRVIRAKFDNKR